MSTAISFDEFSKIDLRIGTIVDVYEFEEAHTPAYKLTIDFGGLGIKKSSAQITSLYSKEDLLNKQIIANVNFSNKQIANFISECLVLGAVNGSKVVLLCPEESVPNGTTVR
jgi:tRNA-binding protein|tara:strand:- start:973 stop:1308 length:336 start_codon:yes stop_codon:yes gene_type:complete